MNTNATGATRGPQGYALIGLWLIKGLLAAAFLAAAYFKFTGQPHMIEEFEKIGLGQSFRYITAVIESVGALLLLWPAAAFAGAVILCGICGGALVAHVAVLHGDLIHVIVMGLLVGLVAWVSRPGWLFSSG